MNELDYERHGRQIALPEIGAAGQRALAAHPVRFVAMAGIESIAGQAAKMHLRAGGATSDDAAIVVGVLAARTAPGQLGLAAVHAVEAARRALGQAPLAIPVGLLAHLEDIEDPAAEPR
ncbi:MAG: hypothetical protein WCJ30_19455 [Deltaproteobacteria bacterium]